MSEAPPQRPPPATDLADDLRHAIGRLARRIRQEQMGGLTASQQSALVTIEQRAPVRLGDLAAAEAVSGPTLTKVVANLEEAGMVTRTTDPTDRRSSLLEPTELGRSTLERIRSERTAFLRRRLDQLTDADRARLAEAMPVLRALSDDAPPR